jgi:hypothetical protein
MPPGRGGPARISRAAACLPGLLAQGGDRDPGQGRPQAVAHPADMAEDYEADADDGNERERAER